MEFLLFLLPLVAVIGALATGRVSLLRAGVIGVFATVPAIMITLEPAQSLPAFLLRESARGAWIAWQAISIIIGGLVLYQVLKTARPDLFAPAEGEVTQISHRQLFTISMLLGPFVEAATGFGVGYLITLTALMRMGVPAGQAIAFGIFSQMLVPWGALGIGTLIGAELGGMPVRELGIASAVLTVPLLFGFLGVFWWMTRRAGRMPSWADRIDDLIWMGLLCALLYLSNLYTSIELGALLATGPLLVIRYFRDTKIDRDGLRRTLSAALPYAVLTGILVITRTVPSIQAWISELFALRPEPDLPVFAIFYHPFLILIIVAVGYGLTTMNTTQWRGVVSNTISSGRVPILVTLVYMVMAQLMSAAGIPEALASAWVNTADSFAVAAVPIFGMVGGGLTGSNTASNGILMALQIELANQAGASPVWIAGIQNTAGCNAILVSPVRIAMGCAIVGYGGREMEIYPWVWPLGVVVFVVLEIAAFMALL